MARNFAGGTDKIVLPAGFDIGILTGNLTFAAWINVSGGAGTIRSVFREGSTGAGGLSVYIWSDNFYYINVPAGTSIGPSSFAPTIGSWAHIAFVGPLNTGGPLTAYGNGASVGSTGSSQLAVGSTPQIVIGNDAFSQPFLGSMADMAFWNTALSAAEIAALAKGVRPYQIHSESLYFWSAIDGLQSPEPDLSGKANNGTVTGTTLAFGPPIVPFTPRWPLLTPSVASPSVATPIFPGAPLGGVLRRFRIAA